MIRYFDDKFRICKRCYLFQAALAGLTVAAALTFFDVVHQPVIIAAFAASGFVAFTMPHREISRPRCLVGGYATAILVGLLVNIATEVPIEHYMAQKSLNVLFGGVAVAGAMFMMTILNTEHAPATSVALGLVINEWTFLMIFKLMIGITIISTVQRMLKPKLIDLL